MFRQGDVLINPVGAVPKGLKSVPPDNGRLILAYGERTGHAHVIAEHPGIQLLVSDVEDLQRRFLRIEAEAAQPVDSWRCRNERGEVCWVPASEEPTRVEACALAVIGREKVQGVVVEHDEHLPLVIPQGDHEVVRQREYTSADMEPIQVAD